MICLVKDGYGGEIMIFLFRGHNSVSLNVLVSGHELRICGGEIHTNKLKELYSLSFFHEDIFRMF